MTSNQRFLSVFLLCLAVAGFLVWQSTIDRSAPANNKDVSFDMKDLVTVPSAEGPVSSEIEAFIQQMSVELAARYKADISKISVQLKLIKLRDYIRVNFPAEGDEVFRRIIFQAFPNYATAIFVNISNMDNYQPG